MLPIIVLPDWSVITNHRAELPEKDQDANLVLHGSGMEWVSTELLLIVCWIILLQSVRRLKGN